jgi:hypothetical protein
MCTDAYVRVEPTTRLHEESYLDGKGPVPGVYLLFDDAALVYIGQSHDIRARLAQHRRESLKTFHSAKFYYVPDLVSRVKFEGILVLFHLPKYNRALNLGLHEGRVWEIKWRSAGSSRRGPSSRRAKRSSS